MGKVKPWDRYPRAQRGEGDEPGGPGDEPEGPIKAPGKVRFANLKVPKTAIKSRIRKKP